MLKKKKIFMQLESVIRDFTCISFMLCAVMFWHCLSSGAVLQNTSSTGEPARANPEMSAVLGLLHQQSQQIQRLTKRSKHKRRRCTSSSSSSTPSDFSDKVELRGDDNDTLDPAESYLSSKLDKDLEDLMSLYSTSTDSQTCEPITEPVAKYLNGLTTNKPQIQEFKKAIREIRIPRNLPLLQNIAKNRIYLQYFTACCAESRPIKKVGECFCG